MSNIAKYKKMWQVNFGHDYRYAIYHNIVDRFNTAAMLELYTTYKQSIIYDFKKRK
jgi:hypothetical protein